MYDSYLFLRCCEVFICCVLVVDNASALVYTRVSGDNFHQSDPSFNHVGPKD